MPGSKGVGGKGRLGDYHRSSEDLDHVKSAVHRGVVAMVESDMSRGRGVLRQPAAPDDATMTSFV